MVFSASNVSSMLAGSGANIDHAVTMLLDYEKELHKMGQQGYFTGSNISGMLAGSASNIGIAIKELATNADKLNEFLNEGHFKRVILKQKKLQACWQAPG